ncbi:MAG: hypothetical protein LQ342_004678 [Letrouitia transgressa]|nr:MAG: hypothetical protein LQ342_004678 [Letrouitia transgressa]
MAYNSITTRLDELRFRSPTGTTSESTSGYTTPSRYSASFMPTHSQSSSEARSSLQRRFTTDLGKMQTLTPIGQQPAHAPESGEASSTYEKKKVDYEKMKEQQKQFEQEFKRLEQQEKRELDIMAQDLTKINLSGHQSEPTTPPEYHDQVSPSTYSRHNRYSTPNLTSPPGLYNRSGRSGSQITSPPAELAQTLHNHISSDTLPSKSVPGSRRGSNDRVPIYVPEVSLPSNRSNGSINRYSLPNAGSSTIGPKSRTYSTFGELPPAVGLGHLNTSFLFTDDDEAAKKESATSPDVKSYLQMNATDDKFPILVRRDEYPGVLSASSAALDLALSQDSGPEAQSNVWTPFASHRSSLAGLSSKSSNQQANGQTSNGVSRVAPQQASEAIATPRQLNRHSMEASLASYAQATLPSQLQSGDVASSRPALANVQSSYSTNDLPTMKSSNTMSTAVSSPKTHAQQQFHNHNASLGRIPMHAVSNRHSRELSGGEARREEQVNGYTHVSSTMQASATPFGSSATTASSPVETVSSPISQAHSVPQYNSPSFYGGYGMQLLNMGMTPLQVSNPLAFSNQIQGFQQNSFAAYQPYNQNGRFQDSQARIIQQRRLQHGEENARFTNVKLEHMQGEIYNLCKDQHGCRYLQKKLEERNPDHLQIIFHETNQHVIELMTDPFGNYLCQKLLEFSNDDQRTTLINNAAPKMVDIALNQHGTRALQKMIDFVTTREQIQMIIGALGDQVVDLIQDLNGNHVIQKCLNRLSPEDAQFIFDATGKHCIVVGTHRHGCCVLQRCIDHASGHQKAQLIDQIIQHAYALVQDPFGNYVLQYIVDLQEPAFTNPLCYSFRTRIPLLSKQKFSSNVIEKCIRGAEPHVARSMIEEMLNANELEKMLRDAFANYVVQTALDYADPEMKSRLIETIRPILPAIRQTPYGRRIQGKIMGVEAPGRLSGGGTPNQSSSPSQVPPGRPLNIQPATSAYPGQGANVFHGVQGGFATPTQSTFQPTDGFANPAHYASSHSNNAHSQSLSNASSSFSQVGTNTNLSSVHQPIPQYARVPQANGFNYF